MSDIAPELLEKITKEFEDLIEKDEVLLRIRKKIRSGKSTYLDANGGAIRIGELLSQTYQKYISSDVLPNGQMYYNIAQRILGPTLKQDFEEISKLCLDVQRVLNQNAGIGIKAIPSKINQDRIDGIIDKISEKPYDKVQWLTKEPVINYSQSIVDDHIRANADFHAKAGLSPKIVRRSAGNCCEWCSRITGTYKYPEEAPEGANVWKRHENCRCTVEYDPGEGKVQDVWSKQWHESQEVLEERKRIGLEQHKDGDKVFITDQAIQKVHPVSIKGYSKENIEFSFQTRKDLLLFSKEQNESNECACVINLLDNTRSNFIKGDRISVDVLNDPGVYHLLYTSSEKSLELTHNHPGLSYLSLNDLQLFLTYPSIGTISIVTNQGKTWYFSKKKTFNFFECKLILKNLYSKGLREDELIEKFLRAVYNLHIERN